MLTTYQDPAQMPNQTQEQAVFDNLIAQFFTNLPKFVAEWNADLAAFNAGVAAFNSAAAGQAYAIPYTIDLSSTADADPGAGLLRFNNATQNLATVLRLDVVARDTADYTKSLDTFDASTSAKKGTLRIVKLGDARKFLVYDVTARAAPAGYRNITVTPVDWSAANPFVNGEPVLLFFQKNGDKGDKGDQGDPGTLLAPTLHVREEQPSGTNGGVLFPNTWNIRILNTTKLNTISGASLATNRITLPAGTYEIDVTSPAWSLSGFRARLYSVTDSTVALEGPNGYSYQSNTGSAVIKGRITIAAAKIFELQLHTQANLGDSRMGGAALGNAGYTTTPEVYSEVILRKVA